MYQALIAYPGLRNTVTFSSYQLMDAAEDGKNTAVGPKYLDVRCCSQKDHSTWGFSLPGKTSLDMVVKIVSALEKTSDLFIKHMHDEVHRELGVLTGRVKPNPSWPVPASFDRDDFKAFVSSMVHSIPGIVTEGTPELLSVVTDLVSAQIVKTRTAERVKISSQFLDVLGFKVNDDGFVVVKE